MSSLVRRLGRRLPASQSDFQNSRIVKTPDGTLHAFVRLGVHTDPSKATVTPPAAFDWSRKANASIHEMYLNDTLGCCVVASRYHNLGVLTGNEEGKPVLATDAEVQATYVAACGPGDQGCDMAAVNTYRQQTGFPAAGVVYKTAGSVSVDHTNEQLVRVALYVFGGLDIGLNLPQTWYESAPFSDWAPVPGDAIVGGHEVQAFGADAKGVWVATWGGKRRILWAAFTDTTWVDELYAELSPVWDQNAGLAPNGINAATLAADLKVIQSGGVP
jgi:hypothetical protein